MSPNLSFLIKNSKEAGSVPRGISSDPFHMRYHKEGIQHLPIYSEWSRPFLWRHVQGLQRVESLVGLCKLKLVNWVPLPWSHVLKCLFKLNTPNIPCTGRKEVIPVEEWCSIWRNEDHKHSKDGNLAKERNYIVFNHVEEEPYQRGPSKNSSR